MRSGRRAPVFEALSAMRTAYRPLSSGATEIQPNSPEAALGTLPFPGEVAEDRERIDVLRRRRIQTRPRGDDGTPAGLVAADQPTIAPLYPKAA